MPVGADQYLLLNLQENPHRQFCQLVLVEETGETGASHTYTHSCTHIYIHTHPNTHTCTHFTHICASSRPQHTHTPHTPLQSPPCYRSGVAGCQRWSLLCGGLVLISAQREAVCGVWCHVLCSSRSSCPAVTPLESQRRVHSCSSQLWDTDLQSQESILNEWTVSFLSLFRGSVAESLELDAKCGWESHLVRYGSDCTEIWDLGLSACLILNSSHVEVTACTYTMWK